MQWSKNKPTQTLDERFRRGTSILSKFKLMSKLGGETSCGASSHCTALHELIRQRKCWKGDLTFIVESF